MKVKRSESPSERRAPGNRRSPPRLASNLKRLFEVPLFLAALGLLSPLGGQTAQPVDYNREVQPILAENCYLCHGPDRRKRRGRLRLDLKETAFAKRRDGSRAIVPGKPEASLIVQRITAEDPEERMPPPDSGKALTPAQIETIKRWIAQGAEWKKHWAFVPPRRPEVPEVKETNRASTPVDRFILARLEAEGIEPSEEADPVTLLRRLSFDLRGLPPEPEEVDRFLAELADPARAPGAYERRVDRYLASPAYGERMAVFWLDLARFADTRGYHSDNPRNVSPYRDYVIRAFNAGLPFDRFVTEQIAGDLLPGATIWQRVATAYHKLAQTTEEGGAQPKEYEAITAADRVRNFSVAFLGVTLGCAQCHDHKFDPFTTKDFYSLAAFFADIQEPPIMDRDQGIPVPPPAREEEVRALELEIAALRRELEDPPPELARRLEREQAEWEREAVRRVQPRLGPWYAVGPFRAGSGQEAFAKAFPPEKEIDLEAQYEDGSLAWVKREDWKDGAVHALQGANAATYLYREIDVERPASITLSLGSDDGLRLWVNGNEVLSKDVYRGVAPDQERVTVPLQAGKNRLLMKISNAGGGYGFYFRLVDDGGLPESVAAILAVPAGERSESQQAELARYFRSIAPALADLRSRIEALEKRKAEIEKSFPRCIVCVSGPPRTVRILPRGNWMDESGPVVEPAIPAYFGVVETGGRRATRLDLARWVVSPRNPLTARAFMNRLWKLFFGAGLSRRLDDLGAMGEPPSHPELLDWLAVEFVESGWDVKHMVRLLVLSSTYRQTSVARADLKARDPYNRLFARQGRWRLDAEFVRDTALAAGGLLTWKIGGPSVKPYQPAGYWANLNFPKRKWVADRGEDAFRRGLYTWWQRSFLHPALLAFDAPTREECTAERPRSNIPQQALVLLNDPCFVEAARYLAQRALSEGGTGPEERIVWMFRRALSRSPLEDELPVLTGLYASHLKAYREDRASAEALISIGQTPSPREADPAELAALTSVARALLNLSETMTRS